MILLAMAFIATTILLGIASGWNGIWLLVTLFELLIILTVGVLA